MGNKASIPAPQQVYRAAKEGKTRDLEELANRLTQLSPQEASAQRAELLEWKDDDGRTPLIVAAGRNHRYCVELLLRHGANVQHVSRKKDGGSALHVAVHRQCAREIIDALLRYGASPFVENSSGFTAMDYAINRKDKSLLRQFENVGFFSNYLRMKWSRFMGMQKPWSAKWVAIVPRHPYPYLPPTEQVIRRKLLIFSDAGQYEPISQVFLDGAYAMSVAGEGGDKQGILTLHPSHIHPKGGMFVTGDRMSGYQLHFKGMNRDTATLDHFVQTVSQRYGLEMAPPARGLTDEQVARQLHNVLNGHEIPAATPVPTSQGDVYPSSPTVSEVPTETTTVISHRSSVHPPEPFPGPAGKTVETEGEGVMPSAPPLPSDVTMGEASAPSAPPEMPAAFGSVKGMEKEGFEYDDNLCVICMSEPKTAGFLHGSSVHKCCCQGCAQDLMDHGNRQCPICRQNIDRVIEKVF